MGSLFGGGGGGGYQPPMQPLPPVQNQPVAPGTLQQTILSRGPAKSPADTLVGKPGATVTPGPVDETDEERRRRLLVNSIIGLNASADAGVSGVAGTGASADSGSAGSGETF